MANKGRQAGHGSERKLRIIGGIWRSRVIEFPLACGLRPTPDRVRETLFNWLQPVIHGSRCLDLFAGSGVLGLEALSRGAEEVLFIESDRNVSDQLQNNLHRLEAERAKVLCLEAVSFLKSAHFQEQFAPFDIVFLDPPYHQDLIALTSSLLHHKGWLKNASMIYLESEAQLTVPQLPIQWQLKKSKKAGQVRYHLAENTES